MEQSNIYGSEYNQSLSSVFEIQSDSRYNHFSYFQNRPIRSQYYKKGCTSFLENFCTVYRESLNVRKFKSRAPVLLPIILLEWTSVRALWQTNLIGKLIFYKNAFNQFFLFKRAFFLNINYPWDLNYFLLKANRRSNFGFLKYAELSIFFQLKTSRLFF